MIGIGRFPLPPAGSDPWKGEPPDRIRTRRGALIFLRLLIKMGGRLLAKSFKPPRSARFRRAFVTDFARSNDRLIPRGLLTRPR